MTTTFSNVLSTPLTVKASYAGDMKRFTLAEASELPSVAALQQRCAGTFDLQQCRVSWRDEDGDLVTIATDADLDEAYTALCAAKLSVLRLELSEAPPQKDKQRGGRGRHAWLEKKATRVAELMDGDVEAAKELLLKAENGDDEAHKKLRGAKGGYIVQRKLQWLTDKLGGEIDGTKEIVHKAIDGDQEAIATIMAVKKRAWKEGKMEGSGRGWGKGCMMGKGWGKGMKGKGDDDCRGVSGGEESFSGCGKGSGRGWKGHGKPLVRALVRLTGMEHCEARQAIDAATEGDVEAQSKIGAALETVDLSSSSSSSSGTSSESSEEDCGRRYKLKLMALKLLRLLAEGDLDSFTEAKAKLGQKMRGRHGHCKGGKGFGGKGFGGKGFWSED